MFVATCIIGLITMAKLNHHQKVVTIRTTTAATPPINSTEVLLATATITTLIATTAPTNFAMLILCSNDLRN